MFQLLPTETPPEKAAVNSELLLIHKINFPIYLILSIANLDFDNNSKILIKD